MTPEPSYKAAREAAKALSLAQIAKADEMERSGAWIPPVAETHRIEHRQLLAALEDEEGGES